ncbi:MULTISPECIES: serine hydrolase domain-containing protein [unclassified Brevibacterium]|uniref:serine hydrolase domain-containing protein n=1 Tax=unclassified Brevibacterium TaxID=2614124 RepID=UPI0010F51453|nr:MULTISPECIES: serine hydrolase domain-containing protein [unclassified Brevibacterium]MCM1010984.1 beta-lactamase family protein [Brevibacterium sp. XM4083]
MTMTSATDTDTRRTPRRRAIAVTAAALTAIVAVLLTPLPRGFQGDVTGDEALMEATAAALGSGHWQHVAVAKVDGDTVTTAGTGADATTEFEIGSLTKTFTAALFADAIDRGEVTEGTRLGEIWPQLDGKAAEVTLSSLAMQRSGLPRVEPAPSVGDAVASVLASYLHRDPYRGSVDDLIRTLGDTDVSDTTPEYSNFGFAVLGQSLAKVSGMSYRELVKQRITQPLGMSRTYVPASATGLSHGYTASGLPAAPWTLGASAPAGAIRSTADDMAIWLRATMEGTAPGAVAALPRADFDEADRIGFAWMTTTGRTPAITWHNGGTGGYSSFLGFTADAGTGIVVLADSAISVDGAIDLISTASGSAAPQPTGTAPAGSPSAGSPSTESAEVGAASARSVPGTVFPPTAPRSARIEGDRS